jgi:peroxiredoxin
MGSPLDHLADTRQQVARRWIVVPSRAALARLARPTGPTTLASMSAQILSAGSVAPDFRLKATPDQSVSLSDFRGRPVVLVFYPADWSPVCGDQLQIYNEILDEFRRYDAQIVAISVDGVWCHLAFGSEHKLHFPLLADFEPKGAVARTYGAYEETDGVCQRALFVVDREGRIAWSHASPIGVNPGADGILDALEQLERQPRPGVCGTEARP